METYRERIGESHPCTKCAEIDLAVTLRLLGNSAQARAIDERALEQLRTSLGHDHVYSLIASINLASDLSALGETEAALALNNETLERCERVLGPDHPTTLAASLNTALDLRAQNRADDGDKRHTDVLSRYRRVLGDEHPATVNAAKGIRADCDVDPLPLSRTFRPIQSATCSTAGSLVSLACCGSAGIWMRFLAQPGWIDFGHSCLSVQFPALFVPRGKERISQCGPPSAGELADLPIGAVVGAA